MIPTFFEDITLACLVGSLDYTRYLILFVFSALQETRFWRKWAVCLSKSNILF